jgi:hypothetical protein
MIPHWVLSQYDIKFQKFHKGDAVPRIKTANGTFMKCLGTKTLHVSNCSMSRDIQFIVYQGGPNDKTIIGLTDAKELRLIWTNVNGTDNIDMPSTNKGGCNNSCAISTKYYSDKCPRCGRHSHQPEDCPFRGANCHTCHSTGHIRGMCPNNIKSTDAPREKLKCARRKSPAASTDNRENNKKYTDHGEDTPNSGRLECANHPLAAHPSPKVTPSPGILKEVCRNNQKVKEHTKKVHFKEDKRIFGDRRTHSTNVAVNLREVQEEQQLQEYANPTCHKDVDSDGMDKLSRHMMQMHIENKSEGDKCGPPSNIYAHPQRHTTRVHDKQINVKRDTFNKNKNSKPHKSNVHGKLHIREQKNQPNVSSSEKQRVLPKQFSWAYYDALVSGQVSHEDYIQEPANGIPERHDHQLTDARRVNSPSTWRTKPTKQQVVNKH